jgi:hypothetical protein
MWGWKRHTIGVNFAFMSSNVMVADARFRVARQEDMFEAQTEQQISRWQKGLHHVYI